MKTFDISKNIILAFIILISIALKLSAHENTTPLISNDNVSIEKDKKVENISKRNLPSKKILCYERNKKGIFDKILPGIYVVIGAIIGAICSLIVSWFMSFRTDRKRKKTIKKELEGNKDYLTGKYENVFKELLENDLSEIKKYLSKKGINNAIKYDFNNAYEFNNLNITILCNKFTGYLKGKDTLSVSPEEQLNSLLYNLEFSDYILNIIRQNISLPNEIEAFDKETRNFLDKESDKLTPEYRKYFIKRLNRLLIEAAYPKESPNIKETRLTKDLESDYFIHLSDTSWNQYKYVISNEEYIISKAYMLIGDINALSNASIHTNKEVPLPLLARAIIAAKDAINSAIEKL